MSLDVTVTHQVIANGNSWLIIKLVGTRSNPAGIGAKVRVKAMVGGSERWQMREVFSGSGYSTAGRNQAGGTMAC